MNLEIFKNKVTKTVNKVVTPVGPALIKVGKTLEPIVKAGVKFLNSTAVIWLAAMVIRLFILAVTTGSIIPVLLLTLFLGVLVGLV